MGLGNAFSVIMGVSTSSTIMLDCGLCLLLLIENNKGILPSEYTQVMIGRRVYRSGESEYLLNKVPCRLKDILDLFIVVVGFGLRQVRRRADTQAQSRAEACSCSCCSSIFYFYYLPKTDRGVVDWQALG